MAWLETIASLEPFEDVPLDAALVKTLESGPARGRPIRFSMARIAPIRDR